MKYFFSLCTVALCFTSLMQAQASFGIKGGTSIIFYDQDNGIFGEYPDVEFSYFGGVFVDIQINKGFHIQPELLYKGIGDFEFVNAPIYLKYDIDYNIHILAGPSLNYFPNFFIDKFRVRADVSFAFDLTENLDISAKYTIGFEEISPNVLFIGIGYRL